MAGIKRSAWFSHHAVFLAFIKVPSSKKQTNKQTKAKNKNKSLHSREHTAGHQWGGGWGRGTQVTGMEESSCRDEHWVVFGELTHCTVPVLVKPGPLRTSAAGPFPDHLASHHGLLAQHLSRTLESTYITSPCLRSPPPPWEPWMKSPDLCSPVWARNEKVQ